ncbi:MAG: PEP-CTERM sorting domain-containing protein [Planctomycetes bacterium]|nr:PEP-CTERM sorting domain-containing protein [Planctomycetota bacterium]
MNKLITICVVVVLGAGSTAFGILTHHVWEFDTGEVEPTANVIDVPVGVAPAQLRVQAGQGSWDGGVWTLSGKIDVIIDNDPTPLERKEITIELLWAPGEDLDPFLPETDPHVSVSPWGTREVSNEPQGGDWVLTTLKYVLYPNPPEEYITITGDILVDKLDITTECIPEPATMGLLGLGGLALLRIRRRR